MPPLIPRSLIWCGIPPLLESTAADYLPSPIPHPPETFSRAPDGSVLVTAQMMTRMGVSLRQPLPLVAIVRDQAVPLLWRPAALTYHATVPVPEGEGTLVVASLLGDPQRRVVRLVPGPPAFPPSAGTLPFEDRVESPPFAAAVRMRFVPTIDGDASDWPATTAPAVRLGRQSFVITDTSVYHGDRDLSGYVRFAWDDSTLYVAGDFTDDSVTSGDAWDVDRVNLVFDMADNTTPVTYESANPTLDQWQDDDYWVFWRSGGETVRRFGNQNADPVAGARLATRRTRLGWTFEVGNHEIDDHD